MLKQLWQWLKRWIQRWFKNSARESDGKNKVVKPRKLLTDPESVIAGSSGVNWQQKIKILKKLPENAMSS